MTRMNVRRLVASDSEEKWYVPENLDITPKSVININLNQEIFSYKSALLFALLISMIA